VYDLPRTTIRGQPGKEKHNFDQKWGRRSGGGPLTDLMVGGAENLPIGAYDMRSAIGARPTRFDERNVKKALPRFRLRLLNVVTRTWTRIRPTPLVSAN